MWTSFSAAARRSAFGGAHFARSAAAPRSAVGGVLRALCPAILLFAFPLSLRAQEEDGIVTIAFTGDVMMAARVGEAVARYGPHYPWEFVRDVLSAADYAVVNLETAVAHSGTGTPDDKQFTFRSEPRSLEGLVGAGVDLVTLANNHSLDYGRAALLETLQHLDARDIARVGAGATASEAYAPVVVRFGRLRIGFIGVSRVYPFEYWQATPTRAGLASGYDAALDRVLTAVDATRPTVDALFVLVHWGAELASEPRTIDRIFTDSLLAHGVSGIIGHHPHVLQGFRVVPETGQLVAWSLGNFVFRSHREESRMSAVLLVDVAEDGRIVGARIDPMYIDDFRPHPAGQRAPMVLQRLRTLSARFATSIDDRGHLDYPEIERRPPPQPAIVLKLPILRIP